MNVSIEDFKTGYYGISIALRGEDIEKLIAGLKRLASGQTHHFHCAGKFSDATGVADIEFGLQGGSTPDNMVLNV